MSKDYSIQIFDSTSKSSVELDNTSIGKGLGAVIDFLKHIVSILGQAKKLELSEISLTMGVKGNILVVEANGAITVKFTKP